MDKLWKPVSENVKVLGRSLLIHEKNAPDPIRYLSYSGCYIEFVFTGRRLSCQIESDDFPKAQYPCYMAVYVDDKRTGRFQLRGGLHTYELLKENSVSASAYSGVKIRLAKETEIQYASSGIRLIITDSDAIIEPTGYKERKIEFIGDSITCGYGIGGSPEVPFSTEFESADDAYAVLCARALDADYQLVSFSGIGVISRYVEPERDEPLTDVLISSLYQETDAVLSKRMSLPASKWEFHTFRPQVIVVNLGTNDASYTRGVREREEQFFQKYAEFLRIVHTENPQAEIVCTLGVMDHQLMPEVRRAAKMLTETSFPVLVHEEQKMRPDELLGCDAHPSAQVHRRMAEELRIFLLKHTVFGRK